MFANETIVRSSDAEQLPSIRQSADAGAARSDAAKSGRKFITYRHPDYASGICVYCGEVADSRDHLIPRGYSGNAERAIIPVVPACRECNSTLGPRFLPNVQDRREVVQARYRRKYRRYLTRVIFGRSDMEQFGPQMRTVIYRGMAEHERIMGRLSWPNSPTYDYDAWSAYWDETVEEDE